MSALLEAEKIQAWYGSAQALFDVNLQVSAGEVVALMGRNGMGKTTTVHTLCRLMTHWQGSLRFAGLEAGALPAHRLARLGIGLVPEGRRCFATLSVRENLLVAARPGHWHQARVEALFPRLAERRGQLASTLSGGEQQMLAIGRALMTNPRLLILDEVTEGLAPVVREAIWQALGQLRSRGLAILVVDKSLVELKCLADRCVIVQKGQTVWQGRPAELDVTVHERYLGV